MISTLEVRYIPRWLAGVGDYCNVDIRDFERVLSKHDLHLYRLANHLFMSKLKSLGIADDFSFPDAEDFLNGGGYSEDDAVFALYGADSRHAVNQFDPKRFKIFSGKSSGILFIDDPKSDEQDLYETMVKALSFYVGKPTAYSSVTFRKYLEVTTK